MAQPTKLTRKVGDLIVNQIRLGLPLKRAAAGAGIGEDTLHEWIRRGHNTDTDRPTSALYAVFAARVEKAQTEFQARHLQNIEQHSRGYIKYQRDGDGSIKIDDDGQPIVEAKVAPQWTASAWLLERRFPQEYGQRLDVQGAIEVTNPMQALVSERLAARLQAIADHVRVHQLAAGQLKIGTSADSAGPGGPATNAPIDAEFIALTSSSMHGNGNGNGSGS